MQIYRFVSRNEASRQFVKPRAQLQFHGGRDSDSEDDGVPACPYTCRMCDREFRHVSSLMQHMVSTVVRDTESNLHTLIFSDFRMTSTL